MADNKDEKKTAPQQEQEVKEEVKEETKSAEVPEETKDEEKDKKSKKDEKKADKKEEKKPSQADELKTANDKYLRLMAEYDNYRKRSSKERESIYQDVRADTVTKFLPVYDNLVRALDQATCDEAYRKGVEMIMTQLRDILSRMGVTEIESLGQKFDPALHNAVMHEEDETKGEGEIVQELQKGFKMGDKVIRFAMVKVAN